MMANTEYTKTTLIIPYNLLIKISIFLSVRIIVSTSATQQINKNESKDNKWLSI